VVLEIDGEIHCLVVDQCELRAISRN
jgi:hypothetical protein